jgi:hypothetical protein
MIKLFMKEQYLFPLNSFRNSNLLIIPPIL